MPSVIEDQLARPQPAQNLDLSLVMSNERSPSKSAISLEVAFLGLRDDPAREQTAEDEAESSGQRETKSPARQDSQDPA